MTTFDLAPAVYGRIDFGGATVGPVAPMPDREVVDTGPRRVAMYARCADGIVRWHLIASPDAERTFCGLDVNEIRARDPDAAGEAQPPEHAVCPECDAFLLELQELGG